MGLRSRKGRAGVALVAGMAAAIAMLVAASTASATSVSGVTYVADSYLAGNTAATWTITFTTSSSGALVAGNTVDVKFGSGFTLAGASAAFGSGFSASCTTPTVSILSSNVVIPLTGSGCSLAASTQATVTITGISSTVNQYARTAFSVTTYANSTFTTPIDGGGASPPSFIDIPGTVSYSTQASDGSATTSGTAPIDASSPYSFANTVTVLGNSGSLALTGYTFAGWCTTSSNPDPTTCGGTHYDAADTFSMSAVTTLYSQWTAAADGLGTNGVAPTSATASSSGNTLTFTYTAAASGLNGGEVDVVVPSGWTPPTASNATGCTTASTGTLSFSSQTIKVTGLTLAGGASLTVTYGATSGGSCTAGDGATAQSGAGTATFTTNTKSTSVGTLTAISTQPAVTVSSAAVASKLGVTQALPGSPTVGSSATVLVAVQTSGGATVTASSATVTASATGCTTASQASASSGVASFTVTFSSAGACSIDFSSSGLTGTTASTSVQKHATTTTLTFAPATVGATETVTATVTVDPPPGAGAKVDIDLGAPLAGSVPASLPPVAVPSVTLDGSGHGTATFSFSTVLGGNEAVVYDAVATFAGDATHASSSGSSYVTLGAPQFDTTLAWDGTSLVATPHGKGTVAPTGSVEWVVVASSAQDGQLPTPALVSYPASTKLGADGTARLTPIIIGVRAATYTFRAEFAGKASNLVTVTLTPKRAVANLGVSASKDTLAWGSPLTLTATGLPGDATGTVTFSSRCGTKTDSFAAAAAHTPLVTTASSKPGTCSYSVAYSGDATYAPAESASDAQVVTTVRNGPSLTLTASDSTPVPGASFTITATVTGGPAGGTLSISPTAPKSGNVFTIAAPDVGEAKKWTVTWSKSLYADSTATLTVTGGAKVKVATSSAKTTAPPSSAPSIASVTTTACSSSNALVLDGCSMYGGQQIIVVGQGFDASDTITGGLVTSTTFISSTQLAGTLAAQSVATTLALGVKGDGGSSATTASLTFQAPFKSITAAPASGDPATPLTVKLTGATFPDPARVTRVVLLDAQMNEFPCASFTATTAGIACTLPTTLPTGAKYQFSIVYNGLTGTTGSIFTSSAPVTLLGSGWTTDTFDYATTLHKYGNRVYAWDCPADPTKGELAGKIWGTDVYTLDSKVCVAAVHRGVLDPHVGGTVTLYFTVNTATGSGPKSFTSSVRNSITSQSWSSEYPITFSFASP